MVDPGDKPVSPHTHTGKTAELQAFLSEAGRSGAGASPHLTEHMSTISGLLISCIWDIIRLTMKKASKKTLTKDTTQLELVVIAVNSLGGNRKSIDTEDVAVKCHELAPGLFSWRKYPEQINLELVRVVLSNAKKKQYRELLTGSGREGWRLTAKGLNWMASRGKELLGADMQWDISKRSAGSIDTKRKQREKARLLRSNAWKNWKEGAPFSVRDAHEVFRIDDYSTGKMLEIKVVRLQSLFQEDQEINAFLRDTGALVLETGENP